MRHLGILIDYEKIDTITNNKGACRMRLYITFQYQLTIDSDFNEALLLLQ